MTSFYISHFSERGEQGVVKRKLLPEYAIAVPRATELWATKTTTPRI